MAYATSPVRGQLVMTVGTGWESSLLVRPWVIYNGSSFMMWYSGEDKNGNDNIGLATSPDGISWSRYSGNPVLKVGASGQWDHNSVNEAAVLREGSQYKMWYTGQLYYANGSYQEYIGYATSPDGVSWAKYAGNPVLTTDPPVAWDDLQIWRPSVVSTGSGYIMYFRGATQGSPIAKEGTATSPDGIHWTKSGSVLSVPAGASGWDAYSRSVDALNLGNVIKTGGTYVMTYVSIRTQSTNPQIGLASSTDGLNWTPYPDNPVITYGGQADWDSEGVNWPMVVAVGNQYFVYFVGSSQNGPVNIGLAMLPMSQYPIPEFPFTVLPLISTMMILVAIFTRRSKGKNLSHV